MKENLVEVSACSRVDADKMTAENRNGYVWPAGLYVIVDNCRSVIESRAEAEELIGRIQKAADDLWSR